MDNHPEKWRPIIGFEGLYEVSSLGRIKRLAGSPKCKNDRICATSVYGLYPIAQLWKANKHHVIHVHRLVAKAFLGDRQAPYEVNHKDGNKRNPTMENLEWVTSSENHVHGHRSGLLANGERHFSAKLTNQKVLIIRASGENNRALARLYGVSRETIRDVRHRKVWKYV